MPSRKPPAPPALYDVVTYSRTGPTRRYDFGARIRELTAREALRAGIRAVRAEPGDRAAIIRAGAPDRDVVSPFAECIPHLGRTEAAQMRRHRLPFKAAYPVRCTIVNAGFKREAVTQGRKPRKRRR